MSAKDISNLPAYDANSLNSLKNLASDNSPEALKAAAKQFEAVFLGMVLKSMRDATPQDGLMDSEQTKTFQSMLDQQLAQAMAAKGSTGLAAMIEKQLSRGQGVVAGGEPASSAAAASDTQRVGRGGSGLPGVGSANVQGVESGGSGAGNPTDFVDKLWPHAAKAGRTLGIPPHFMIAQAALETGWGKSEMVTGNGSSAHNLFGVKAGKDWNGPVVEQVTTEYVGGVAQKVTARFRAYASYEEAFNDYAKLLKNSPRYAGLAGTQDPAGFAQGLQQAGYATDPMYASKLERIISGPSLRRYLMG